MDKWLRAVDALHIRVRAFNILDSRGWYYCRYEVYPE